PGPLEVEAAQVAADVEHLADEVQARRLQRLHGLRRNFTGIQYVGWTTLFLSTERGTGGCTKATSTLRGAMLLTVQHVGWTTFFLSTERGTGGCTKRHPQGRCYLRVQTYCAAA